MKILLIGGHLAPALAVIDALPKNAEIVFVGRKSSFEGSKEKSLEYIEMQKRNIKFYPLNTGRLQRHLSRGFLPSLLKVPKGLTQARKILAIERPDVVVGFGGYLSLPVGLSAALLRIPLIIHEQTFQAGLANKMLSRFARRICISWESSSAFFPKPKTVLTGNPLPVISIKKENDYFKDASNLPILLVTGGSSGSHAVNILIESALPVLLQEWRVFHQTGDALEYQDFSRLEAYKASIDLQLSRNYEIVKFVNPDQMEILMREAKIVVGRSGINTVSQLLRLGKPSLLIPLPAGQSGEQLLNAQVVQKKGMASILLQKDATSEKVIAMLDEMVKKYESFTKQAGSAREMIREDAASKIVAEIEYVVKEKTS